MPMHVALGLAFLGSLVRGILPQRRPPHRVTTTVSMINSLPGGRFIVQNFPLREVILTAYGLREYQLVDDPTWESIARLRSAVIRH